MIYLIETDGEIDLRRLGEVTLKGLRELNTVFNSDYNTRSFDPILLSDTETHRSHLVGAYDSGFDGSIYWSSDSVIVDQPKSIQGVGEALHPLVQETGLPDAILIVGVGDASFLTPTGRLSSYLLGHVIKDEIPGAFKRIAYCSQNREGQYRAVPV